MIRGMTIRNCRDRRTADFLKGNRVAEFQAFERQIAKAIAKLQAVSRLVELRNPPSNRFEALGGDRQGQYSIRVNDRWRVCFCWAFTQADEDKDALTRQGESFEVEIVDYHRR